MIRSIANRLSADRQKENIENSLKILSSCNATTDSNRNLLSIGETHDPFMLVT
nr:MAG TPA: hypothetical protein [Caudoviricetes sp.]